MWGPFPKRTTGTAAVGTKAFLVLRVVGAGARDQWVPLTLVVMSVAYAVTAWPAGHWSDTASRRRVLMAGLLTLLIAHILLATTDRASMVLAGVAVWGVQMGLTQGVLSALIADRASPALRGAALGLYAPANGVALLVVGTRGGLLWERGGSRAPFWLGAAASVAALLLVRRLAGLDQD